MLLLNKIKNIIKNMELKAKTKIRKQGKISLITTIPKKYIELLEIKQGDEIEWIFDTTDELLKINIIKK